MKLTILMYHKVDALRPGVRYPGNYVTPAQLAEQMDALATWGYSPVSLTQWLDFRDGRGTMPHRPFVVTFDDGYTCFDRNAWPILRARGITPTVFLVASQIGGFNAWDADELREPLLDAGRIRALQDEGVHFGSHTETHRPLARIAAADAMAELTRSRAMLTDLLGREVDTFAYPYSNQSRAVRAMVRDAGYRGAVRGKGRMNWRSTSPFGLYRIKPDLGTTVASLRKTLTRARFFQL